MISKTPLLLLCVLFLFPPTTKAQLNTQDSLALVDLYNSTHGANWLNNTNWLTAEPVSSWYGIITDNNRVTYIDLPYNHLKGFIPFSIGNISMLTELDISYNQLSDTIPSSIGNLVNLYTLYLYNNQLSGHIPGSIGNLVNLSDCGLNNNRLTGSIPESIGNLINMRTFSLSYNQLSDSIPSSIGKLRYLFDFSLNNNQLTGNIPATISTMTGLNTLVLNDNLLTGEIPSGIGDATSLTAILLNNNKLSGSIPASFKDHPIISAFYIQDNFLTFDGMENIIPATDQIYAPQSNIPIHQKSNKVSVSAGGDLTKNTYQLFKDGVLATTQVGDSIFAIGNTGKYSISVTNPVAPLLTLNSDTLDLGFIIADTTMGVQVTVTGTDTVAVNNGFFKIAELTPAAGAHPLSGNVTATVTVDTAVTTFNGQPFVQKHYDIVPATNASTAQATITLYFTQQDFDNYNNYVTSHGLTDPLLPTNKTDNGHVRITQFHGTFTGSSNPANYNPGTTVFIIPSVSWSDVYNCWVVSFPVTGFSGFFISTRAFALPLSLLDFKGSVQKNAVALEWTTTNEINTREFIVERSTNSLYNSIGSVPALSVPGNHTYYFTDINPVNGTNLYRLKMVDKDGRFSYSPVLIIKLNPTAVNWKVYPNPVKAVGTVSFTTTTAAKYSLQVINANGTVVKTINGIAAVGTNTVKVDLHPFAKGNYLIQVTGISDTPYVLKVVKQ